MDGKFSILMNCYNGEQYLRNAIDSIYNQTYSNWEIIFIDNCSTDKSEQIVACYDDKIKYFKTPKFMSLCEARVFAKPFISGDYLSILDVDDVYLPNRLAEHIKIFNQKPEIDFVYSNTYFFNDNKQYPYYKSLMPSGNIFSDLLKWYFISFETVSLKMEFLQKEDIYFSPKYNVCSDMEIFMKCAIKAKTHYIDQVLAKWRFGHVSESDRKIASFPKEKEMLLEELGERIESFKEKYSDEISIYNANVNYLYGNAYWSQGEMKKARNKFKLASQINWKYRVVHLLSYFVSFNWYNNFRFKFSR